MCVSTVLVPRMCCGSDVEPGGVIQELIDRDDGPCGQRVFEGIELPQGRGCGSGEGNVGGLRTLLRGRVDMADTGQQSGDRCRSGNLPAREHVSDDRFVVYGSRAVVPPVGFELFADAHELVDNVGTIPAGGLLRCSRTWVQGGCGLMLGSGADLVEHAARDFH